jgi:hypothetical protein
MDYTVSLHIKYHHKVFVWTIQYHHSTSYTSLYVMYCIPSLPAFELLSLRTLKCHCPVATMVAMMTVMTYGMWNCRVLFKVCNSVHHHTIQINHQPDATFFQFIILTFVYNSTCFGPSSTHHQELNDCSSSLRFYLLIVVIAVLYSWSGRPAWPRIQHGYHHDTKVKPEAATAVIELLMMRGRRPETCWAVNKRQDNKLEDCCIWLVIYLNCVLNCWTCFCLKCYSE